MIKILTHLKCGGKKPDIYIDKYWVINHEKVNMNRKLHMDYGLSMYIHEMELPTYNPFVSIFNSVNYSLTEVVKGIVDIYNRQKPDENSVQSCDLYLQYLRKDSAGCWTNLELNDSAEIMIVDIYPYIFSDDTKTIDNNINILRYTDYEK